MNKGIASIAVAALTAFVIETPMAFAETVNLKASLNAAQSVPPTNSDGTGSLQGSYDTVTNQLTYTARIPA